jgi:hypothetical protein
MNETVLAVLIVAGVIVLYFVSYFLNSKTETPSDVVPISSCATCTSGACSLAQKAKVKDSEEESCDLFEK